MWYKSSTNTEGLTHRVTKEVTVFGKNGQYWEYSTGKYGVLVYGNKRKAIAALNAVADNRWEELPPLRGGELLLYVRKEHLKLIKMALLVPAQQGRQLALAKRF